MLWNPKQEDAARHFLELDDGTLHPLTATGAFSLSRLRLNRPALVALRLRRRRQAEETRLLARYRELTQLLEQLLASERSLVSEQSELLKEQQRLLRLLLGG